ncbi:hypothetical protein OR1_01172 [Geobacter sp. OR-1]|uniref:YybS family protein n=1 Tax=Geobacter sp. OR-1 TaxID=1266765 RepID=UPI0005430FE0|nr:YybS family protein [Geobacter sp. OR-1]GAM08898.1 hypothetical protein OR1_01172 [Geobacter sp. OR-1]
MNFPSKGVLPDILKGSVATVALFLAYASLPLIGMLGGLLAPLPGVYYSLRVGKIAGGAIVIVSAALLGLISDVRVLILYLLQSATVSLLLPLFLQGRSVARAIVLATGLSLAIILAVSAGYSMTIGINLDAEVQKWLSAGIAQTAALYSKSGLKEEELRALQDGLRQAGSVMVRVYPAMLAIGQAVIVVITMLAIAGFARRGKLQLAIGEFRDFRNIDHLIWLLIISGFALLIPDDTVSRVALNLLLVVCFAYFFQGLAVLAHFFTRFAVPAIGRFFFYFFLILQPYLLAGVAILGIFDMWGNFRTPKQQNL